MSKLYKLSGGGLQQHRKNQYANGKRIKPGSAHGYSATLLRRSRSGKQKNKSAEVFACRTPTRSGRIAKNPMNFTYDIRANVTKNRLYLRLVGFMSDEDAVTVADCIIR